MLPIVHQYIGAKIFSIAGCILNGVTIWLSNEFNFLPYPYPYFKK